MTDTSSARILIVDDEAFLMKALRNTLRDQGYETVGVCSGAEALEKMRKERFDLLLSDLMMPEMSGLALLRAAREIDPELIVIIMTGAGTIESAVEAMQAGAFDYILKPFELRGILPVLSRAQAMRRLRSENSTLANRVRERTEALESAYRDLTGKQKELEEKNRQLDQALQEAQSAVKAKSEFLAIMSHEIRTPMNGVIGMTSILSDTELTEMQRDCVQTIHASGQSLLTVINDILDYSKIEAGKMQLENHPFNLRQCVEEALDIFAEQIRTKKLEAAYMLASDIPSNFNGDLMRLRQILVNMIGNAIKFTEHGEIVINVASQTQDEKGYHLLFSVTDTGIGISQEGIEKLFQPFQQVDTSATRRYGGTGLGLVISRRLSEFMGGTMWVKSEPDRGSTFFFTAVLTPAPEKPAAEQAPTPGFLPFVTVLIVDDNKTNRRILELQLKTWGMNPVCACSGEEALEKLATQNFAIVLTDLQMPEMDGVMLARKIRQKSKIPMVLLSSSGEKLVGEEASLFRSQILKPIKLTKLFNVLLKITGADHKITQSMPLKHFDAGMAGKNPLRILLVEDNPVNRKVVLMMLSRLGYEADVAVNGLRAVEAAEKARYDLIFMDIQMPEMNGIDASRIIREKLGSKCPVIYALTAEALEGDRERFLSLGFDGYLSKPLQADPLKQTLKSVQPAAK